MNMHPRFLSGKEKEAISLFSEYCRTHPYSSHITLGTRAALEPQRGGKTVTVLPLVMG
jgi:hypothetical protein